MLSDTDKLDDTYDAFEKDIGVVSFYFENPTVLEFGREIFNVMHTKQYQLNDYHLLCREERMTGVGFMSQVF